MTAALSLETRTGWCIARGGRSYHYWRHESSTEPLCGVALKEPQIRFELAARYRGYCKACEAAREVAEWVARELGEA